MGCCVAVAFAAGLLATVASRLTFIAANFADPEVIASAFESRIAQACPWSSVNVLAGEASRSHLVVCGALSPLHPRGRGRGRGGWVYDGPWLDGHFALGRESRLLYWRGWDSLASLGDQVEDERGRLRV